MLVILGLCLIVNVAAVSYVMGRDRERERILKMLNIKNKDRWAHE